jgi:hypothetical protein
MPTISDQTAANPEKPGAIFAEGDESITYGALDGPGK